jgi:hypothetical protein
MAVACGAVYCGLLAASYSSVSRCQTHQGSGICLQKVSCAEKNTTRVFQNKAYITLRCTSTESAMVKMFGLVLGTGITTSKQLPYQKNLLWVEHV